MYQLWVKITRLSDRQTELEIVVEIVVESAMESVVEIGRKLESKLL